MRHLPIAAVLALLAAAAPARAAEQPAEDHAGLPQKVIALGDRIVKPLKLTMSTEDLLVFQNDSGRVLKITFLEPDDVAAKVSCRQITRLSENESVIPGALFRHRGDDLIALVAPSARVSVCGLAPGHYVYTVTSPDVTPPNVTEELGEKGEIVVQ